jgi:hypothetical protein
MAFLPSPSGTPQCALSRASVPRLPQPGLKYLSQRKFLRFIGQITVRDGPSASWKCESSHAIIKLLFATDAAVAQWIEYWPPKPRVVGSIPASRTNSQALNWPASIFRMPVAEVVFRRSRTSLGLVGDRHRATARCPSLEGLDRFNVSTGPLGRIGPGAGLAIRSQI